MSNEIAHSSDDGNTLYALVYRVTDMYIYDVGDAAFEVIGTWNNARAGECDIAMTAAGDAHFADFPAVAPSIYFVVVRKQVGGSPSVDDLLVGQGIMNWDGAAEISLFSEQAGWLKNG